MAQNPAASADPPLDEIQWRTPPEFEGGIHNNSVLYYFAQSPFYEKTSNNEVVFQQGINNAQMTQFLATRELFEGRLRTMSGLEFIVAQEPAETGPGAGTGVWVINKQTRRKRQGEEDEITVHAVYFMVGENIYMAPSLFDIMSSRIASISTQVSKALSIPPSVETWSAAQGRTYLPPPATTGANAASLTSTTKPQRDATPLPDTTTTTTPKPTTVPGTEIPLPTALSLEEAFAIHEQFGDHYMDRNPITGKPGDFHLAFTGRKPVNLLAAKKLNAALPALNTKLPAGGGGGSSSSENPLAAGKPAGKETKSPKTPGGGNPMQRAKKRKGSKAAVTPQ